MNSHDTKGTAKAEKNRTAGNDDCSAERIGSGTGGTALHQVETDAVLAVQKVLQAVEDETAAYRKRIQAECTEKESASPETPTDSQ